MTEHHDSSSADAELSVLMPESSARPALRRPTPPLASKERRYNDNRSEREYAALDYQVGVARFVRGPVDLKQAEFAVVVVDPGSTEGSATP
ncbi:hypothetical protein OM076_44290 [Solirubrobacter ginsenosidimutans]|uniref:Uncharacterized protein n=1 Tax=Solirubrobacter ginsenosidimutans TaxID=490573 RepID=A0A9X3N6C4_9ACTN|nr:hypothetical protein [Solirubrobacter ginsenosidimutans]MDA0167362.1 hypothetical protein [Solirubrobacter ginsenosidimutans]